jgi:YesN/AraC family two-component response regulator
VPRQILLVDDDPIVREVVTLFLKDEYEIGYATTGADALERLRGHSVDLIVLDQRLPDCTGLDLLSEFRSIRPNLPVIMLTGYGSEWICAAAFKLGVGDYFPKPVSPVVLVAAVRRILSGPEWREGAGVLVGSPASPCIPIQKAMGLIQQRYWDQISLSGLARQVGMSKYRLSHRFRQVVGVTFRDYLRQVRLERAKALLATGHVSITEIAQIIGFGDLPRFDKLFKRYTGLTPSAYRSRAAGRSNK